MIALLPLILLWVRMGHFKALTVVQLPKATEEDLQKMQGASRTAFFIMLACTVLSFLPYVFLPSKPVYFIGMDKGTYESQAANYNSAVYTANFCIYAFTFGGILISAFFDQKAHNIKKRCQSDAAKFAERGQLRWYHVLVSILLPYVGFAWGIINLVTRRRRSGFVMTIISGVLIAILVIVMHVALRGHTARKKDLSATTEPGKTLVLPTKPPGKALGFFIYWSDDINPKKDANLHVAEGVVSVMGDGSPPERIVGLSYRYQLKSTVELEPGTGHKFEATISPEAKAVILKIRFVAGTGRPLPDPADYTAILVDANGSALASQQFTTKAKKGDWLDVPLPLPSGLKSGSVIRLVISETGTDQGIVIPLSVINAGKSTDRSEGSPPKSSQ